MPAPVPEPGSEQGVAGGHGRGHVQKNRRGKQESRERGATLDLMALPQSPTASWPCPALANAELASATTLNVGGRVEWLFEPTHPDQLVEAYRAAREKGYTPRILGGGANVILPDGVLPGVVIATSRMSRVFRPRHPEVDPLAEDEDALAPVLPHLVGKHDPALAPDVQEDPRLVAWAGLGLPGLVRATRLLGWSGLEGLVGVPGQLGGGVAMNAGGRWGDFWDVVESVRVLTPAGEVRHLERDACQPRYRDGNLDGAIVLGACMRFEVSTPAAVRARVQDFLAQKSAAQPLTERSSGCVFKNPSDEAAEGRSAGKLIEECGCKGLARGGALVSPKHANFIVNRGGATAQDVLGLIAEVRERVADRTGIRLELEVKIWKRD